VGVKFSGIKQELSTEWEGKIKSFLKIFLAIKNTANQLLSGVKEGRVTRSVKKLPVSIEVSSPAISLQTSWAFKPREQELNNEMALEVEAKFGFTPLIAGKGILDVIACAKYIPELGQIIEVIDTTLGVLGVNAKFTFSVVGEINVMGDVKFLYSPARGITWHKAEINTADSKFGLEVYIGIKGEWKVKQWILWGDKHDLTAEASVKAASYFVPNFSFGADDKGGPYIAASVDFSGIAIVFEIKAAFDANKFTRTIPSITIMEPRIGIIKGKHYFHSSETKT